MEKKNNKKIFIILGCIVVIVVAIIVGTMILKKGNNDITNIGNTEQKEETKKSDYSALENDVKKAINDKDLIKASSYYTVLKFSMENDKNADTTEYDKITNDLQALKDERKAELLTKVNSSYDDMTQVTQYTVKGAKTEFDEDTHLMTVLAQDKTSVAFGTQFGIVQEGWIFFDSLIVNVDGEVTNIAKNNIDKYTETIGGGYIFEYCAISIQKYPMFNALVEKMINGNEIKVRFVGKPEKGNVDHIITASEKESLAILYELSLCL